MKFLIALCMIPLVVIYIIFGPVLLVREIQTTSFYLKEADNTTQVEAVVVDIDETSGSDSGTEYDIYVSYLYHDKIYRNVYWKSVSYKTTYSLSETVYVEIFNARPDDIVDVGFTNSFGWAFPLFITIIGPLAVIKTFYPDFTLTKKRKS